MKFFKFLFLTILFASSFSYAGNGVKGGVLVFVNGQWVPIEEAMAYTSGIFMGTDNLPTGDANSATNPEINKDYRSSLENWLSFFDKLSPSQSAALRRAGLSTRFIYVNRFLAFIPDEIPKSDIDFGEYRKAAIYRSKESDQIPTIYVSIPAMESMGSLGNKRLTEKENQGFELFHELINATYPHLLANPIMIFGRLVIDAYLKNWTPVMFGTEMTRNGSRFITDPNVTLAGKMDVLKNLDQMGILYKVKLDGYLEITKPEFVKLNSYNQLYSDHVPLDQVIHSQKELVSLFDSSDDLRPFGLALDWTSVFTQSQLLTLIDGVVGDLPGFYSQTCGSENFNESIFCSDAGFGLKTVLFEKIKRKSKEALNGSRFLLRPDDILKALSPSNDYRIVGGAVGAGKAQGYCLYIKHEGHILDDIPSFSLINYDFTKPSKRNADFSVAGYEVDPITLTRRKEIKDMEHITRNDNKARSDIDYLPTFVPISRASIMEIAISSSCIPVEASGLAK